MSDFSLVAFDCVAVTVLSAINAQSPKKNLEKLINSPLAKTFFALEYQAFLGEKGKREATLTLTPCSPPTTSKTPLPYPLGRPDTQAIGKRQLKSSGGIPISIVVDLIFVMGLNLLTYSF